MVNEFIFFSGGLFVGAILALRYIAPMIYMPVIDALRRQVARMEIDDE
jgi:hypothetical protein